MFPANKAVDNKNARDRNVNVNSGNARNKAAVAAKNVVAANKADDKPGYLGKRSGGSYLPPLCPKASVSGERNSWLSAARESCLALFAFSAAIFCASNSRRLLVGNVACDFRIAANIVGIVA